MIVKRAKTSPIFRGFLSLWAGVGNKAFVIILYILCIYTAVWPLSSYSQTASILPLGRTQFLDSNGNPLSGGKVYNYIVGTTTFKNTWQDGSEVTLNTNPVILDAAGRALIYGQGTYRQIVRKADNSLVWDAVTSATGSGGGTVSTGDGDLVGTVKPWAGISAPNQYAFAFGQELSRSSFSALMTAITLTSNVVCTSTSNTLTGISDTSTINVGAKIEVLCMPAGTTVVSKTASTITANNPATLTINASAVFFQFGNGNGTTTFNVPDLRGRVVAGPDNMGGVSSTRLSTLYYGTNPNAIGAGGGADNNTIAIAQVNLPAVTLTTSIASGQGAHTHTYNNTAGNLDNTGAAGYTTSVGTGQSTGSSTLPAMTGTTPLGGSGTGIAFSIIQPSLTLNYIIKITPDTNSSVATGVTSLGLMTGDIACGSGLVCTGNTISVTSGVVSSVSAGVGISITGGATTPIVSVASPLPAALAIPTPAITGGTANSLTGLSIRDTGAAFDLSFVSTVTGLSANRSITLDTLNGSRIITLAGNINISGSITTSGSSGLLTQTYTGTPTIAFGAGGTVVYSPVPIANGGTSQITAPLARSSAGLNVEAFTGHGNSIYTILSTDRVVGTNAAFTASRTWTLPAANAVNAGQGILIADFQGTVTGSNTLIIQRAGADTVNGSTNVTISAANGAYLLVSDGTSKWTAQATGAASAGGVTSVTCNGNQTVITTSGTCASRETLTGNRTYYVRDDGNDSNTCLVNNSGGACLTIQAAVNKTVAIDIAGFAVTIQVNCLSAPCTYAAGADVATPFVGGNVTLQGDTTTPSNVVIATAGTSIRVANTTTLFVKGFKLTSSGSYCLLGTQHATVHVSGNMEYGACNIASLAADNMGLVSVEANYSLTGAGSFHLLAIYNGLLTNNTGTAITVTQTGTLGFTTYAAAARAGQIVYFNVTYSGGTITGTRWTADALGSIFAGGCTVGGSFQGSVNGSATNGGVCT